MVGCFPIPFYLIPYTFFTLEEKSYLCYMKTLMINVDNDSSLKLLLELAKKLHFKTRVLSEEEKEDAGLLAMMEERKNEVTVPASKIYEQLRKIK